MASGESGNLPGPTGQPVKVSSGNSVAARNTALMDIGPEVFETRISCPYCGEPLHILVDTSDSGSEYIEDCQVCCNPILLRISSFGDTINIETAKEETGF